MLRRIVIAAVAVCALGTVHIQAQKNEFFRPKEVWNDTEGNPINAHGGGILYHKGTYYWYGEYKVGKTVLPSDATWERYRTDVTGVSCYSSKDLLNWKVEGVALKAITDDPNSDIHPTQVLERPKVVYNKKTKKFVMWMHIDSPDYSKAEAGVAIADSPTGPFKYLDGFPAVVPVGIPTVPNWQWPTPLWESGRFWETLVRDRMPKRHSTDKALSLSPCRARKTPS